MIEEIKKCIKEELRSFNMALQEGILPSVPEYNKVLDFIFSTKGKQIRPIIGILISKMLGNFSWQQNTFLQAVELIHNATLFHDDIIDEADIRRNKPTLNKKFSNKIAVLSGDYFLSCAIEKIYSLENKQINFLFSYYMKQICEGEIEQNLSLNKLISIESYLEKTKRKTALLFALTTGGVSILADKEELSKKLLLFGETIGMIYQLKDDLKNFEEYVDKPVFNDLKNGIITAPVIFLAQNNKNIKNMIAQKKYDEILLLLKKSNAVKLTKELIQKYVEQAFLLTKNFPENMYKNHLLALLSEFG